MATKIPFSKRRLEDIPTPESGRVQYRDSKCPGLVLRVTANGAKTFAVYKKVRGRPLRYRLGSFPEMTVERARRQAVDVVAEIGKGQNPANVRHALRKAPTLQDAYDVWIEHAKLHKRTWKDDQRQFDKYFGPLKNRQLMDITMGDVTTWHARIGRDHGRYMANRARALLSTMFAKAKTLGFTGENPCEGVPRFKEESRDRFLLPEEVPKFVEGLAGEEPTVRDFFWICLLTGARKSNALMMRWDQLAMEGVWRIPETKNGLPVLVPLVETAQNILRARREAVGDTPWVFPGPGKAGHLVEVRKAWVRVCERAGLEDLRIHDLRRTLGSWQAAAGASETIIGKSLGHRPGSKATAIYARLQLDPVRASMDNATDAMLEAANGTNGKGEDDD